MTAGTSLAAELGPEAKVWLKQARPSLAAQNTREQVVPLPFTGKRARVGEVGAGWSAATAYYGIAWNTATYPKNN